MAQLNIHTNILMFADPETVSSNPKRRNTDWTVDYGQIAVRSPENREYLLQPGETKTIYSGVRTLTSDVTTEYALTLNTYSGGVYRLTNTGGQAPGFRTARALALAGETVTVSVNNNATVDFTLIPTSVPTFAAVQVGDTVFIPDVTTGDTASPFNQLNVGFWTVLAIGASGAGANRRLTCRRLPGQSFQASAEAVAVVASTEFKAFSSAGVQVGDTVVFDAGFSQVTWGSYSVRTVTADWIEFASGEYLPLEADILPGVTGVVFYSEAKSFLRIEADQRAVVRYNGATDNSNQLKPRVAGDQDKVGYEEKWGPVWSLVIVNLSRTNSMQLQVISAVEAD